MFLSNSAYEAVNETHIIVRYRFRDIFYSLVCLIQSIIKEFIGVKLGGQKGQKEVNQLKIGKFTYGCTFSLQITISYLWLL